MSADVIWLRPPPLDVKAPPVDGTGGAGEAKQSKRAQLFSPRATPGKPNCANGRRAIHYQPGDEFLITRALMEVLPEIPGLVPGAFGLELGGRRLRARELRKLLSGWVAILRRDERNGGWREVAAPGSSIGVVLRGPWPALRAQGRAS